MTNAERIRLLDDEELAVQLSVLVVEAFSQCGIGFKNTTYEKQVSDLADDLLIWLREKCIIDGEKVFEH